MLPPAGYQPMSPYGGHHPVAAQPPPAPSYGWQQPQAPQPVAPQPVAARPAEEAPPQRDGNPFTPPG
jgi:hypothetical protein